MTQASAFAFAPERGVVRAPMRAAGGGLPEEMAAWLAAAPVVLDGSREAEAWDTATRQRVLAAIDKVSNTLTVARARVVTAEQAAGTWALKGDRNLAGYLGRTSRQGRGAGQGMVEQARTLTALPAVAEAMVDGPVTPRHLQEITRATEKSPLLASHVATEEGQAQVVELARRYDGSSFGKRLERFAAGLDPAARQREHDAQVARQYLTFTHRSDGTEIHGFVDSVTGHKVQKMVDAFNPRPAKDDTRPRDVRQAAALGAAAEHILSDTRTTPGATAPVQAVLTITQETWAALRAPRAAASPSETGGEPGAGFGPTCEPVPGSTADVVARLRGVPAVVDEAGTPWPASEVARALCDCVLTRAVVDAPSEDLMLGRDERLFTRNHWLALLAAGQLTCAVDGCSMPLRYTQLHHMRWWEGHSGETSLANCAPECSFHHHEIHRNGIVVSRRADGSYEHRWPDGRIYGGAPPDLADDSPPGALPLYDAL